MHTRCSEQASGPGGTSLVPGEFFCPTCFSTIQVKSNFASLVTKEARKKLLFRPGNMDSVASATSKALTNSCFGQDRVTRRIYIESGRVCSGAMPSRNMASSYPSTSKDTVPSPIHLYKKSYLYAYRIENKAWSISNSPKGIPAVLDTSHERRQMSDSGSVPTDTFSIQIVFAIVGSF